MQLAVNTAGIIEQFGTGIGERDGCTILDASAETEASLEQARTQSFDVLVLNADGTVTAQYDQAAHDARRKAQEAAEQQRASDMQAVLGIVTDPTAQAALARILAQALGQVG